MRKLTDQKLQRCNELWQINKQLLLSGDIKTFSPDGNTDFILTLLISIENQKYIDISKILYLQRKLKAIDGIHYYYPKSSLHITLVGCTPFYNNPNDISKDRIKRIKKICQKEINVLNDRLELLLYGLNLNPYSIYLQVFPINNAFQQLVKKIIFELKKAGEFPIEKNDDGIRLSIMKYCHNNIKKIDKLLSTIEEFRNIEIGMAKIDNITLYVTDRTFSPNNTEQIHRFDLAEY